MRRLEKYLDFMRSLDTSFLFLKIRNFKEKKNFLLAYANEKFMFNFLLAYARIKL